MAQEARTMAEIEESTGFSKPKHPLTAYNIFFLLERDRIIQQGSNHDDNDNNEDAVPPSYTAEDARKMSLQHKLRGHRPHRKSTHGKIGFKDLTLTTAARWKHVDAATRKALTKQAAMDRKEYSRLLLEWKLRTSELKEKMQDKMYFQDTTSCISEDSNNNEEHQDNPFESEASASSQTEISDELLPPYQATIGNWIENLKMPLFSLPASNHTSSLQQEEKLLHDGKMFCSSLASSPSCKYRPERYCETAGEFDLFAPLNPEDMDSVFDA